MKNRNVPLYGILFAGVIIVSFAGILVRLITISPLVIAFYRVLVSALFLLPFLIYGESKLKKEYFLDYRPVVVGFFLGLHFFLWIAAFEFTSVANAVVFVALQPIFTSLLEYILAREDFNRAVIPGILLAFIGSLVISYGDISVLFSRLWGNLLALGAAFFAGCYFLGGRSLRREIDYFPYIFIVYSYAALFLGLVVLVSGQQVTGFSSSNYFYLLALAIGPTLIGHSVVNYSLRQIPATIVAVALLGEPILTTIMAWLILGEAATLTTIGGGVLILLGIYRVIIV